MTCLMISSEDGVHIYVIFSVIYAACAKRKYIQPYIILLTLLRRRKSAKTPTYTKCRKHTNQNCNDFLVSRYI